MTCPTLERLAEYQADLLGPRGRGQLRRHLARCPRCQRELAALSGAQRLLESLPAPPLRADLWPGVAARLQARPRRWRAGWWAAAMGVGVAASLFVGLLTARPTPLPTAPSSEAAPYMVQHELLGAQDPLADRAGIGVVLAAEGGSP